MRRAHCHVAERNDPAVGGGERSDVLFGGDDLPPPGVQTSVMSLRVTDASAGGSCRCPRCAGVRR